MHMHDNSSSSSSEPSIDSDFNDIVRLCLHGETEVARLFFQPDILYFGELYVGENSQRVVRISNPLKFAPLFCRYVRNASAHCYPETILLKPEGSIEVLLKVRAKENGMHFFYYYFFFLIFWLTQDNKLLKNQNSFQFSHFNSQSIHHSRFISILRLIHANQ